jgi:pyruvate dehydrogenase E2 component (dihydrolipoamide acetyltransferase)
MGVAVALDWGLIVPVVRNADHLSLVGLARAASLDLADPGSRRRSSRPRRSGAVPSRITNPGIFGTVLGFPIVNQPQVAIMGVGAVEKRPVVVDRRIRLRRHRQRGSAAILSLGYDHRLVNGADADRFLARVKEILENFPEAGA